MVNRTDATLIAVDVGASLAAESLQGQPITLDAVVTNTMISTVWHYALRDTVYDLAGAQRASMLGQTALKAGTQTILKALTEYADGRQPSHRALILYMLSQAAATYAEPTVLELVGENRPTHARPSRSTNVQAREQAPVLEQARPMHDGRNNIRR